MGDLDQQIAVVTGAGSGIGRSIAQRLASDGATVAVMDLVFESAKETVAFIESSGAKAVAFEVDVSDTDAVVAASRAVVEQLGVPTIVVNNAGWSRQMPFLDTTPDLWRRAIDVNYLGQVAICHAFVKEMVAHEIKGTVVNVASDAGRVGSSGESVYAGAKGAVIAFTKSLAREVARYGINANCVAPGPTDTPMFQEQPEKFREALIRAIPFRRVARPEDIAAAVAFFASPDAVYITGQVLSVSGGLTMSG